MKKITFGIIGAILGASIGVIATCRISENAMAHKEERESKFRGYYNMLAHWLALRQEGKSLEKYFIENGYKTVAIYGMGGMGNRLYRELKDSLQTEVVFAVDKNSACGCIGLKVMGLDDDLPKADVVVVTATFAFDSVHNMLRNKVDGMIVSLEEVIYGIE